MRMKYDNPAGEAHYGKAKSFPMPATATGKVQKLKRGVPMNNPTPTRLPGIRPLRAG